jgi:ComF family protein
MFNPVIVPVPLHFQRERARGFNQSQIIAGHLARKTDLPLKNILIRTKNTEHLANIKGNNKRREMVKNAFQYVGEEVPRAVLLIDDVITTTSTIGECVKTLKKSGVETVLSFSLAK